MGSSTASVIKTATKRSFVTVFVKNELGPSVNAARLEYRHLTLHRNTTTTRGRVPAASARSGGHALKQQSWPELRLSGVHPVRRGWW